MKKKIEKKKTIILTAGICGGCVCGGLVKIGRLLVPSANRKRVLKTTTTNNKSKLIKIEFQIFFPEKEIPR